MEMSVIANDCNYEGNKEYLTEIITYHFSNCFFFCLIAIESECISSEIICSWPSVQQYFEVYIMKRIDFVWKIEKKCIFF